MTEDVYKRQILADDTAKRAAGKLLLGHHRIILIGASEGLVTDIALGFEGADHRLSLIHIYLSRIESGHADLVRTRFDLRTLCREAVETFRLQTPEEVVLDVEKGLPSCTVCQYRQGLMQILANFIRNALKFTPKGFVTVGFERKRDRLSLYVRDTGIGIPAEELDKIFERFYKVDTFTQGTGLGLSICKSIAEQMGAQIGVDSAVGEGS